MAYSAYNFMYISSDTRFVVLHTYVKYFRWCGRIGFHMAIV